MFYEHIYPRSGQHKWQLKIKPKKKLKDLEYLSAFLYLSDFGMGNKSKTSMKARYQISLIDAQDQKGIPKVSKTVHEFKKGENWGFPKFILTSELLEHETSLIVDDTLKIHCRVWIEDEVKEKTGTRGAYSSKEDRTVKQKLELWTDLGESLRSTKFSDFELITPTKTFKAHKIILSCRSKVFAAMFESNMLESSKNAVKIEDFDAATVEEMLNYIYTGEVNSFPKKATDLLRIADKYDLQGLKNECELTIAANLNVENAAEILILANLYDANVLKPKLIDFVNRNKDSLRKTKKFEKFVAKNPAVFLELYFSQ